jgi:hypothetical protein
VSVNNEDEIKWRIDAWDALAGRAFLCRRQPDGDAIPQLDSPVVFVAPPYFQPEPLASRAPGLAATRSTFQVGLFFEDGEEAGFETLDDAIAFIRRGYNSHGSEPTGGVPGLRPIEPIRGGGGDLALPLPELARETESQQLDQAIASLVIKFNEIKLEVKRGDPAEPFRWDIAPSRLAHVRNHLVVAGSELVLEMLRRLRPTSSPSEYAAWTAPACNLGAWLWRLELWDSVSNEVSTKAPRLFNDPKDLDRLIRLFAPVHGGWQSLLDAAFVGEPWPFRTERVVEEEIYAQFASFPLPEKTALNYRVDPDGKSGKQPSLLTLLSTWFGAPRAEENTTFVDRALLLFAGACVVVVPMQRENRAFLPWWTGRNSSLTSAFRERLASDLWNWIAKQLPDRVYHAELEGMLRTVPPRWSRASTATAADPVKSEKIAVLDASEIAELEKQLGEVIERAAAGGTFRSMV